MSIDHPPPPAAGRISPAAMFRIARAGDCALVVTLGEGMNRDISRRVLALGEAIMAEGAAGLVEVVPGMATLTLHFDPDVLDTADLTTRLAGLASRVEGFIAPRLARRWTIPACYDPALAPDLDEVAERCGLEPGDLIQRHAGRDFHVYMLGFLPGFPYMGDIDLALRLPRRSRPRVEVPPGSVAIAGAMTAVYPAASPGGWHLIGRTPVSLFDAGAEPPSLLAPGDSVRFQAVGRDAYEHIAEQVRAGTWRLAPEGEAI